MTDVWPGKWHSKTDNDEPSFGMANDHGTLYLTGNGSDEWVWYESDGYDPLAEVRR